MCTCVCMCVCVHMCVHVRVCVTHAAQHPSVLSCRPDGEAASELSLPPVRNLGPGPQSSRTGLLSSTLRGHDSPGSKLIDNNGHAHHPP